MELHVWDQAMILGQIPKSEPLGFFMLINGSGLCCVLLMCPTGLGELHPTVPYSSHILSANLYTGVSLSSKSMNCFCVA